jgi:hypothetical protein
MYFYIVRLGCLSFLKYRRTKVTPLTANVLPVQTADSNGGAIRYICHSFSIISFFSNLFTVIECYCLEMGIKQLKFLGGKMKDTRTSTAPKSQDDVALLKNRIAELTSENRELKSAKGDYKLALKIAIAATRESITMQDEYSKVIAELEAISSRPDPLAMKM